MEAEDKVLSLIDKNEMLKKVNEYVDNRNKETENSPFDPYTISHASLDTLSFDGYITDKNGNNLIFMREDSIFDYSQGQYCYFIYDTADGSMKCDADIDEVFNIIADTERFPNAVEPIIYNSKEVE